MFGPGLEAGGYAADHFNGGSAPGTPALLRNGFACGYAADLLYRGLCPLRPLRASRGTQKRADIYIARLAEGSGVKGT